MLVLGPDNGFRVMVATTRGAAKTIGPDHASKEAALCWASGYESCSRGKLRIPVLSETVCLMIRNRAATQSQIGASCDLLDAFLAGWDFYNLHVRK